LRVIVRERVGCEREGERKRGLYREGERSIWRGGKSYHEG
jgi:hypothetical protein